MLQLILFIFLLLVAFFFFGILPTLLGVVVIGLAGAAIGGIMGLFGESKPPTKEQMDQVRKEIDRKVEEAQWQEEWKRRNQK